MAREKCSAVSGANVSRVNVVTTGESRRGGWVDDTRQFLLKKLRHGVRELALHGGGPRVR
jgi:hypothetical protein